MCTTVLVSSDELTQTQQIPTVVFRPVHHLFTSQNKWIVGFSVSLTPYEELVTGLRTQIIRLQTNADWILNTNRHDIDTDIAPAWRKSYTLMKQRQLTTIDRLLAEHRDLRLKLDQFRLLTLNNIQDNRRTRHSRSLFPFIGTILKGLFGTADQSTIKSIRKQIRILAESDKTLAHLVDDSLSIINATRLDVDLNRKTINSLLNLTQTLQVEIKGELHWRVFSVHYAQIASQTAALSAAVLEARSLLNELEVTLSDLFQGHLTPSIIPPSRLTEVLQGIAQTLPSTLALPFDIRDLHKFYQFLESYMYPEENGFTVIIDVPLSDITSKLNIFKILTFDIPFKNTTIVASYDIPHKYVGVSPDMSKVGFLTPLEIFQCTSQIFHFCKLATPLYHTNTLTNNCIVALLTHSSTTQTACKTTVTKKRDPSTTATYFGEGTWKISTPVKQTFTIVCADDHTTLETILPPLGDIHLSPGCYARCPVLSLPPFFHNESHLSFPTVHFHLPPVSEIWSPVARELSDSIQQLPRTLDHILDYGPSIFQLKRKLKVQLRQLDQGMKQADRKPGFLFYGLIVCIVFIFIGIMAVGIWYIKLYATEGNNCLALVRPRLVGLCNLCGKRKVPYMEPVGLEQARDEGAMCTTPAATVNATASSPMLELLPSQFT